MTLADALALASRAELEQLASSSGMGTPAPSGAELAARLTDAGRVRQVLAGLPAAAATALRVVWIGCGGNAGAEALSHLEGPLRLGPEAGGALGALARNGLVIPRYVAVGRYLVPDEIVPALQLWTSEGLRRAASAGDPGARFDPGAHPEAPAVLGDLARLLGRLRAGVAVAGGGHVYKREQQRLAAWLAPPPEEPPSGPRPAAAEAVAQPEPWAEYDLRLGLLLALAASFQLVRERPGGRGRRGTGREWIADAASDAWLALAPWSQWWALVQIWLHLAAQVHDTLPACALAAMHGPLSLARAREWWRSFTPARSRGHRGPHGRALGFLVETGWWLGALEVDGEVIRCTPAARAALLRASPPADWPAWEERFYVQADFEVIAPPYLLPRLQAHLAAISEPVRVDRATVARLTRAEVSRAVLSGESAVDLEAFLASGAAAGVPQNVGFTLREWAGDHQRLALEPAVLLRLDDAAVADRVRAVAAVRALVREEITPTLWSCEPADGPRLWDLLRRSGFEPRGDPASVEPPQRDSKPAAGDGERPAALSWPGPSLYAARYRMPTDAEVAGGRAADEQVAAAAEARAATAVPDAPRSAAAGGSPETGTDEDDDDPFAGFRPSAPVRGWPPIPEQPRRGVRREIERASKAGRAVLLRDLQDKLAQFDPLFTTDTSAFGYCHDCDDMHFVAFGELRGAKTSNHAFVPPDD